MVDFLKLKVLSRRRNARLGKTAAEPKAAYLRWLY